MSKFTIKHGSYCPACRGFALSDCTHTMDELRNALSGGSQLSAMNDALAAQLAAAKAESESFLIALMQRTGPMPTDWQPCESVSGQISQCSNIVAGVFSRLAAAEARVAEAERDAARYRFIKQWARRLDITGYSLTNNEHFEPRIDEAMQLRPADSAPAVCSRCNGHGVVPDSRGDQPCPECSAEEGRKD